MTDHKDLTDDPIVKDFIKRHMNAQFDGGTIFDDLLKKPVVTIYEPTFIKYVVAYYREPTDQRLIKLYDIIKNPRASINVLDPKTDKLLFTFPPIYCKLNIDNMGGKHGGLSTIEKILHESNAIRRRAGAFGEIAAAKQLSSINLVTDEVESNNTIIEILRLYGVNINNSDNDDVKDDHSTTTPNEYNKDDGYIDEW